MRVPYNTNNIHCNGDQTEPVDIEIEEPIVKTSNNISSETIGRISYSKQQYYEYYSDSPLIISVKIIPWHTNYDYYSQFRKTALEISKMSLTGNEPHSNIPFFSYMPQYAQMDGNQFAFYLYLRNEIINRRYPPADYSYIQIFIYETINLSGIVLKEELLNRLISVWLGYRETYPRIDVQLSEWVCDFCLINQLNCPSVELKDSIDVILKNSSLKEFWIDNGELKDVSLNAVLTYCSNYNYKKSKFYSSETKNLYDSTIYGVIKCLIKKILPKAGSKNWVTLQKAHTIKDAYVGALCVPDVKKRLEIDYYSVSHSFEFRFLITDALKYTENRIRSHLGIKTRISHGKIPLIIQETIDIFLKEHGVTQRRSAESTQLRPEYEKLYDVENKELSVAHAAEIETESWITTKTLTDAFASDVIDVKPTTDFNLPCNESMQAYADSTPIEVDVDESAAFKALLKALDKPMFDFLKACYKNDFETQKDVSMKCGKAIDLIASDINGISSDLTGDILIEKIGNYYTILDDYKENLSKELG